MGLRKNRYNDKSRTDCPFLVRELFYCLSFRTKKCTGNKRQIRDVGLVSVKDYCYYFRWIMILSAGMD